MFGQPRELDVDAYAAGTSGFNCAQDGTTPSSGTVCEQASSTASSLVSATAEFFSTLDGSLEIESRERELSPRAVREANRCRATCMHEIDATPHARLRVEPASVVPGDVPDLWTPNAELPHEAFVERLHKAIASFAEANGVEKPSSRSSSPTGRASSSSGSSPSPASGW